MTFTVMVAGILGAATGLAVVATVAVSFGWLGSDAECGQPQRDRQWVWLKAHRVRLAAGLGAGAVAWVFTGWPVAGLAAVGLVWATPRLFGTDKQQRARLERVEAVAAWAESLRDTLQAASGLEQAITTTAAHAPPAIAADVRILAEQIADGGDFDKAVMQFAARVDDEIADLVAVSLATAHRRESGHLADLLSELADAARSQAGLRMRIGASRARVTTSTRVITIVTLAMVTGLIVLNGRFLAPYSTVTGQMVLLIVVGVFAGSLWWLARLARDDGAPRLLRTKEGRVS